MPTADDSPTWVDLFPDGPEPPPRARRFQVGVGDRHAFLTRPEWCVVFLGVLLSAGLPSELLVAGPILAVLPLLVGVYRWSRPLALGIDGFRLGDQHISWSNIERLEISHRKDHRVLHVVGRPGIRSWTFTCADESAYEAVQYKAAFDALIAEASPRAGDQGPDQAPYRASILNAGGRRFHEFAVAATTAMRDDQNAPEPWRALLHPALTNREQARTTNRAFIILVLVVLAVFVTLAWNIQEDPPQGAHASLFALVVVVTTAMVAAAIVVFDQYWEKELRPEDL